MLPKSASLVEVGPPRVILYDGKRHVEQLDAKGSSDANPVFEDGDGNTIWSEMLRLEAESEHRRQSLPAPPPNSPAPSAPGTQTETALVNARSEIAQLTSGIEQSRSLNNTLNAENNRLAGRVLELEKDNARLAVSPERVELENLQNRVAIAERNTALMEGAIGLSGLDRDSIVATVAAPGASERDQIKARLQAATDPQTRGEIANELRDWDSKHKHSR